MEAQYSPIQIEEKWSKIWADRKLEKPGSEDHFSQIIPPPNVTGTLHTVSYTHIRAHET